MRVVVYNDEGTAIAGRTDNTPLRSTTVNRSARMLALDGAHDIACPNVAFAEAVDCMLCPEETDEALRATLRFD